MTAAQETRNDTGVSIFSRLFPDRQNKHDLFEQQEGRCNGCRSAFEFRHLEVKGDRPQEYLVARLREMGMAA